MRTTVWRSKNTYGIRVGRANRDQWFSRDWVEIEVEMDGTFHRFRLTPGFWNKCPEFRDSGTTAIRDWLQRHRTTKWAKGEMPEMELTPLGGARFRLVP